MSMLEPVLFLLMIGLISFLTYEFFRMRKFLKKHVKELEAIESLSTLNPGSEIGGIESKLTELQSKVNDQEKVIKKLMKLSE